MFFVGKRSSNTFPWTRDSQCQNSANSLAGNSQNALQNFSPICLPKPKTFEFLKKSSLGMSVVRDLFHFFFLWTRWLILSSEIEYLMRRNNECWVNYLQIRRLNPRASVFLPLRILMIIWRFSKSLAYCISLN